MAEKQVRPRVHVLVLCDDVENRLDEEGIYHLLGVRTVLGADSFPFVHPALYIYLQVSGHEGESSGAVLLQQARTDDILKRKPLGQVRFPGPLTMVQLVVRLRNCEFPEPGVYYVQVTFGGVLVAERAVQIVETRSEDNE